MLVILLPSLSVLSPSGKYAQLNKVSYYTSPAPARAALPLSYQPIILILENISGGNIETWTQILIDGLLDYT